MPTLRCATLGPLALAALLVTVSPVTAQGDPDAARFHFGSLALSPTIRLTNIGYDSNVFNLNDSENPQSDMTATASPAVEAWFRTPRVRATGRSQTDVYYFHELTTLRAFDTDHSGRVEVVLNRVMPYVSGAYRKARHRQNFEIDAIAGQQNGAMQAGAYVRLTRKSSVGLYLGRSHVEFERDSLFRGTDLAHALNHTSSHEGLAYRYEATPLTTFAVNVERGRARFASASLRDSNSLRIVPSVEFKPFALVSGTASIGFGRVRFREGTHPDFRGSVASVDLGYQLRNRTRLNLTAQRSLEYSYVETQVDYVLTGFTASATQRLGDRWDAVARLGRHRLGYRERDPRLAGSTDLPADTVRGVGMSVGYSFGRTRIGFEVDRYDRLSAVSRSHGYDRLRIGSSLTHVF